MSAPEPAPPSSSAPPVAAPRGRLAGAATGLLPGALAGAHLALLLFFLNPALPFAPGPVVRAALAYGLALGLATLLALLPWTVRPARAWRLLPWTLTAALAFSAALDWVHASRWAYFLPGGINDRLIKTALWLTLAALIGFYTALLHSLGRRPYGPRSRWALAAVALLSLVAAVERRQAFHPRPEPRPVPLPLPAAAAAAGPAGAPGAAAAGLPPAAGGPGPGAEPAAPEPRPRLIVVAPEGATLDAILPLAGDGRLPFFATLLQEGAYGRLQSLSPHRSAALWATLATGKYPYRHGVTGDPVYPAGLLAPGARLRLLPVGIGFRRWGTFGARPEPPAEARTARALWEVLPRLGVPSGVVDWPGSYPPAEGVAFALTDRFFAGPPAPDAGRPQEIAEQAQLFRVREGEIDPALLARFGPGADRRLRRSLAGDLWRESLALHLAFGTGEPQPVPAFFLDLPGLEGESLRSFGGFYVVQFEGAKARVYREAAQAVAAYYEHLDELLGTLWSRREGPAILAVVSAYGVEGPGRWRRLRGELSREAAVGGTTGGSPDGVLLLYGDGIRKGALLTEADLVDVAPTLLYALGFPVPRDLDGKVLTAAFDRELLTRRPLTFVSSYEEGGRPGR